MNGLLQGLEVVALTVLARWTLMRLRRVLLLPTNDTTPSIGPSEVQPQRKIVVSDLHLGAGDRADDFTSDDEFAEFVTQYVLRETPVELILNGDTFEFLQVRLPGVGDYDFSVGAAVQRLNAILAAHPVAIGALRHFVAQADCQLTLMIGNHDFELHYAGAKQALRRALGLSEQDARLRFGIRYAGCGVYLEHGNQFDSWNAFVHFDGITQPFEIVRGTRVVKDVINPLEQDPLDVATLIDNVKPTSAFLWYMLSLPRLRTPAARRYVTRGLMRMFRTVALPTMYSPAPVLMLREELLGAPGETLQREMALQTVYDLEPHLRAAAAANHGGRTPELKLRQRGASLVQGVTKRLGRNNDALDELTAQARRNLRDEMRAFKTQTQRAMARIAASPEHSTYTLFSCGHTHTAEVLALADNKTYTNTGTWTEVVWNIASGLFESRRFPFLEITYPGANDAPIGRLLVWYQADTTPHEWNDSDGSDKIHPIVIHDKEEML